MGDKRKTLCQLLESNVSDVSIASLEAEARLEQLLQAKAGFCVECQDQPREVFCEQCQDDLCSICFDSLHRRGNRQKHQVIHVKNPQEKREEDDAMVVDLSQSSQLSSQQQLAPEEEDNAGSGVSKTSMFEPLFRIGLQGRRESDLKVEELKKRGEWLVERCKFIPLRLTLKERKFMRLVKNALDVSEYTDKVDILTWSSKTGRIHKQLKEICSIICGLVLSCDYQEGQRLLANKNFEDHEEFFGSIFELTRRHKIRNPEKLRDIYGKLVHVLMDAQNHRIKDLLGFSVVTPLKTVHSFLKENGCLHALIEDFTLIMNATEEIDPTGKRRNILDKELRARDKAFKNLVKKWSGPGSPTTMTEEAVELCFRSIGDNHNYLRWNRDPVDRMIAFLKEYFHPDIVSQYPDRSLSIRTGKEGARLSHPHQVQYHYVLQSMSLWREILSEMFQLWYLAELDLFDSDVAYSLRDTGQGLNRVQSCPRVSRAMRHIVHRVHKKVGSWVGSSVVHLGDRAVPNALIFVDKYNQVPAILNPIDNTIRRMDALLEETPSLKRWVIQEFGSTLGAKVEIMGDFFRHGFDGSGADNFYDAGSCIDGRLTSAWNWCQNISKKRYFPIFLLCGFSTFDGEW